MTRKQRKALADHKRELILNRIIAISMEPAHCWNSSMQSLRNDYPGETHLIDEVMGKVDYIMEKQDARKQEKESDAP